MTLATPTRRQAPWFEPFVHPSMEFGPQILSPASGRIPARLQGSLYRNGPGRLERRGQRVGHWFDGDGLILAVHFRGGEATGISRYVQTAGYKAEAKVDRFLFGGYGMTPPGPIWQRFGKGTKNVANTSVLALPDRLLALWEGGWPHALDLETLATLGPVNLEGLKPSQPFSAHPKQDPHTQTIYNFGVVVGRTASLQITASNPQGQIVKQGSIPLKQTSLVHDWVIAGPYLVFCVPPLQLNPWPVLLNLQSFSESFSWQPQMGTEIIVVDRDTLKVVSRQQTDPWYQWHFSNGFVDQHGSIVVDLVRYKDFQTNQFLREVPTGKLQTYAPSTLTRVRITPETAAVEEIITLTDRFCEFPTLSPYEVGQAHRRTYLSLHHPESDPLQHLFNATGYYDHEREQLVVADLGEHRYPSEPLFLPDPDQPEQGWVLTVVFDGDQISSQVWIYESEDLESGPICILDLPSLVPFSFHGTWSPR